MIGGNPTTDSTPNSSFSRHQQSNDSPLVTDPATNIKNPAPGMMVYDSAKNCSQYNGILFGHWRQP